MKPLAQVALLLCAACKVIPDGTLFACQQKSDCPTTAYQCAPRPQCQGSDCAKTYCLLSTSDGGFDGGVLDGGMGAPDSGVTDAGSSDGGVSDGGLSDAGAKEDGGLHDAGAADAGEDAGMDGGIDAGPDAGLLSRVVVGFGGPVSALVGSPSLALAGEAFSGGGGGLFVTLDGGQWADIGGPLLLAAESELSVAKLAVDAADGGYWYAQLQSGRLFASADRGGSWGEVSLPLADSGLNATSLSQLVVSGSTLFAVGDTFYEVSFDGGGPHLDQAPFSISASVSGLALDGLNQTLYALLSSGQIAPIDLTTGNVGTVLSSAGGCGFTAPLDFVRDAQDGGHLFSLVPSSFSFSEVGGPLFQLVDVTTADATSVPFTCWQAGGSLSGVSSFVSHLGNLAYAGFNDLYSGSGVVGIALPDGDAGASCSTAGPQPPNECSTVAANLTAIASAFQSVWGLTPVGIVDETEGSASPVTTPGLDGIPIHGFSAGAQLLFGLGADQAIYALSPDGGSRALPATDGPLDPTAVGALSDTQLMAVGQYVIPGNGVGGPPTLVPDLFWYANGAWTSGDLQTISVYGSVAALPTASGGVFLNWGPSGVGTYGPSYSQASPNLTSFNLSLLVTSPPSVNPGVAWLFVNNAGSLVTTSDGATFSNAVALPSGISAVSAAAVDPTNVKQGTVVGANGQVHSLQVQGSLLTANRLCSNLTSGAVAAVAYDGAGNAYGSGPAGLYDLNTCQLLAIGLDPGPVGAPPSPEPLGELSRIPGAPHLGLVTTGLGHTFWLP